MVFSVASTRELIGRADASDNLTNARDESVRVPYRRGHRGAVAGAAVPFDVVLFPDGVTAPDRVAADRRWRLLDRGAARLLVGSPSARSRRWSSTSPAAARAWSRDCGRRRVRRPGPAAGRRPDRRAPPRCRRPAPAGRRCRPARARGQPAPLRTVSPLHLVNYDYDAAPTRWRCRGRHARPCGCPRASPRRDRVRPRPARGRRWSCAGTDERHRVRLAGARLYTIVVFRVRIAVLTGPRPSRSRTCRRRRRPRRGARRVAVCGVCASELEPGPAGAGRLSRCTRPRGQRLVVERRAPAVDRARGRRPGRRSGSPTAASPSTSPSRRRTASPRATCRSTRRSPSRSPARSTPSSRPTCGSATTSWSSAPASWATWSSSWCGCAGRGRSSWPTPGRTPWRGRRARRHPDGRRRHESLPTCGGDRRPRRRRHLRGAPAAQGGARPGRRDDPDERQGRARRLPPGRRRGDPAGDWNWMAFDLATPTSATSPMIMRGMDVGTRLLTGRAARLAPLVTHRFALADINDGVPDGGRQAGGSSRRS